MRTMAPVADGQASVGRVSSEQWAHAVECYEDGRLIGGSEEDRLAWEAAGLVTDAEGMSEDWQQALELANTSPIGLTLVARHDEVVFMTSVFADPKLGRLAFVTQRARSDGPDSGELVGLDPLLTVMVSERSAWWEMATHVLPPHNDYRSSDQPDAAPERVQLKPGQLTEEDLFSGQTFTKAVQQLPSVPPGIRALVTGDVTSSLFVFGANLDGTSEEVIWFTTAGSLHRLHPREGALYKVRPGDVATGLQGILSRLS